MNATERDYAAMLVSQRLAGAVVDFRYEALSLRLADPANASDDPDGRKTAVRYNPDFLVICEDRIELHEVKGHMEDDALVKLKVAATLYPWFVFRVVYRKAGRWIINEITPEQGSENRPNRPNGPNGKRG